MLDGNVVCRGALILSQVDALVRLLPRLRDLFFLVERRAWRGVNDSEYADVKLVEDLPLLDAARRLSPHAALLPFAPADFVDTDAFVPLHEEARWDVLQIACWAPYKRIELFIQAASLLPQMRFAHIGHFPLGGTPDELRYRDHCLALARATAPNIEFLGCDVVSNRQLPSGKSALNALINAARFGVLTSVVEGVNRFKMECLSTDRPFLVAADAPWPTRKHINRQTGCLFAADPKALSQALTWVHDNTDRFAPREYILMHSGRARAVAALREALQAKSRTVVEAHRFAEIDWDGRNQSLVWGHRAISLLRRLAESPPDAPPLS